MRKILSLILVLALSLSICLVGTSCAKEETSVTEETEKKPLNIMYVVPMTLGDNGSADAIMKVCEDYVAEQGGEVTTFECSGDASLYEPTMLDVCACGEYDVIITGNYNLVDAVCVAAADYPEQKIIVFDAEVPYEGGINQNVFSIQAKQNECAFLAGALAALMTKSTDAELSNPEQKLVGFVGGGENTAIQDFLVGYIEGVNYVDSSIEVLYSFVGNWSDAALAKELTMAQFQEGADVSFAVCGSATLGVAEAAKDANRYCIGVDSDYAAMLEENYPETAAHIPTSAIKDWAGLVEKALEGFADGTLPWGTHQIYGYKDGGVALVENEYYDKLVPDSVKAEYQEILSKLLEGGIEIGTAIGATQEQIDAYKEQAKPF